MDMPEMLREQYNALVQELCAIGPFRLGSITERARKCGKPRCACGRPGHPGHGPQTILTFKQDGTTRTINLPSAAAVKVTRHQLHERERFVQWSKRWAALQQSMSELQLKDAIARGEEPAKAQGDEATKKKRHPGSWRKSSEKSGR
jgi:hypothetical protein